MKKTFETKASKNDKYDTRDNMYYSLMLLPTWTVKLKLCEIQQKKKYYGNSSYIYGLMLTKMAFVFIKKQKLNYADMLRRKTKHAY